MKSTFNHDCSSEFLDCFEKRKKDNSYVKKLIADVKIGEIFLAFRPNNQMTFYYEGRRMCTLDAKKNCNPMVDAKYLPLVKSDESVTGLISEDIWKKHVGNDRWCWAYVYSEIKDNLCMAKDPEATQISRLYRFSPLASKDSDIILLDIETQFSYPIISGKSKNNLRIDTVLYDTKANQLAFIEVKRLADIRLQKKGSVQKDIIQQMTSYETLIDEEKPKIIQEFNKSLAAYERLSGRVLGTIDENKDILLGLLITEYPKVCLGMIDEIKEELVVDVNAGVAVFNIGNIMNVTNSTLALWYDLMRNR